VGREIDLPPDHREPRPDRRYGRASLSPEKLSDRDLVAQIEDRVGNDLQYHPAQWPPSSAAWSEPSSWP